MSWSESPPRKRRLVFVLRAAGILALALVGLFAVLLARTLMVGPARIAAPAAAPFAGDPATLAGRLAEAVRFPTVSTFEGNAPGEAETFAAFRAHLARAFPLTHARLASELVNNCALIFRWDGRDRNAKPVLLLSHLDVVPAEVPFAPKQWTYPPFEGRIADGFVWGRGTWDDKLGVMGILEASEALLAEGFVPARTVYFHFGCDEEVTGSRGAARSAALFAERGIRFEWAFDEGLTVADGIIPGVTAAGLIGIAEKGYLSVDLVATTEGGHSSMPARETAIGVLADAINCITRNPMPAVLPSASRRMLTALGPEMPFWRRLLMANLWLFEPLVASAMTKAPATNASVRTTSAPTIISGGIKDNVLPPQARATINFRIRPGDSIRDVMAHIKRVVGDPRVVATAHPRANEPTRDAAVTAAGYGTIATAIRQIFPDAAVAPALMVAATDSRFFLDVVDDVYRFDPVRATATDLPRFHGVDERISIAGYFDAVRFYRQVLINIGP